MSDSSPHKKPETQTDSAGVPPRPPKKTARGFEDQSPDDRKRMAAAARTMLAQLVEKYDKKQK
jgi:hypothetical protein